MDAARSHPERTLTVIHHVLAIVGSVLYMSVALPALFSVLRNPSGDPVTPVTLDLMLLSGMWWLVYSYDIGNIPSLVSTAVSMISPMIIFVIKLRNRTLPTSTIVYVVLGAVVLLLLNEVNVKDVGLVAAVFSFCIVMPSAWRSLVKHQPVGNASPWFWILQAVTSAVWFIYGISIHQPLVGITGIIVAPTALLIARRVARQPAADVLLAA